MAARMPRNQMTTAPVKLDAPTPSGDRCTSSLTRDQKGSTIMPDTTDIIDRLHDRIQNVLDVHPPERWTEPECRAVLGFLADLAVAASAFEIDEVGR